MSPENDIFAVEFGISEPKNKEQAAIDVLRMGKFCNSLNIWSNVQIATEYHIFTFPFRKWSSMNQNDRSGAKMSVGNLGVGDRPSPTRMQNSTRN